MNDNDPSNSPQTPRHGHDHRQGWHRDGVSAGWAADDALVELAGALAPGRALDLGAGAGRNSLWLARAGWDVTAVDQSPEALAQLARSADAERLTVRTVVGDIVAVASAAERFDLVVVANLHPPADERARIFAAAAEAVAPGGHLYVAGHHVDAFGHAGPPFPERLYTSETLEGAFPGLEILRHERRQHAARGGVAIAQQMAWAHRPSGEGREGLA